MEILSLIALPVLSSLLIPIILEWFKKRLSATREKRELDLTEDQHNDQVAAAMRDELREDNKDLRARVIELQKAIDVDAVREREELHRKLYAIKKEKLNLQFELNLVRQELDYIRRQYEEYTAVRRRAAGHLGDNGGDSDDSE